MLIVEDYYSLFIFQNNLLNQDYRVIIRFLIKKGSYHDKKTKQS